MKKGKKLIILMIFWMLLISSCQTVIIQIKDTNQIKFDEYKGLPCEQAAKSLYYQLVEIISDYDDLKDQLNQANGKKIYVEFE